MTEPTPDDIRAALERILSSRCFAHAGRSSDFLRFVVEETLAGAGRRLKGYTIGIEVFGRPPDFDPQADPLVRVEAGRLRSRLAEYYQGEGVSDPIRIDLPRGGYAAAWSRIDLPPPPVAAAVAAARAPAEHTRWRGAAAALAVLLGATVAALAWQFSELRAVRALPADTPAPTRLVVAESPRIIVVPFESYTPEHAELRPFVASLTEEVMLALGRLDVRVIAAEPRWLQSGRVPDVSSHDYVLSGSVRLAGNRVRVAARLVERGTGVQLWSRAYDHPHGIETEPELQAALARDVAAIALPYGPIFDAELSRARAADEPTLRDCLTRYLAYRRAMDVAPFRAALECYQSLSLREPAVAAVWAGLAMVYLDDYGFHYGHTASLEASLMLAREAVERALALDRSLVLANMALARLQFFDGRFDEFHRTVDRVLELEPGNAEARAYLGTIMAIAGDPRGIELVDQALALSPHQPGMVNMAYVVDYLRQGRSHEALEVAQRVGTPNWFPGQMIVAATAGLCGDERLAERARTRLLQLYPNFEAEAFDVFAQWHHDPALNAALVTGLIKAGLAIGAPAPVAKQWPESWL